MYLNEFWRMSNNLTPVGQCEAMIIASEGENVADQILFLLSFGDSNTGTEKKYLRNENEVNIRTHKRENVIIDNKYKDSSEKHLHTSDAMTKVK